MVRNLASLQMSQTFLTNGTYTVPPNVFSIMVMVIGAQGGTGFVPNRPMPETNYKPGFGANITGIISTSPGEVFNVTVGTNGKSFKWEPDAGAPRGGAGFLSRLNPFCTSGGGGGYSSIGVNGQMLVISGGGGGIGANGVITTQKGQLLSGTINGGNAGFKPNDYIGDPGGYNGGQGGTNSYAGNGGKGNQGWGGGDDGDDSFGGDGGDGGPTQSSVLCSGGGGGGGGGYFGGGGGSGGWLPPNQGTNYKLCSGSGGGGGSSFLSEKVELIASDIASEKAKASVVILPL